MSLVVRSAALAVAGVAAAILISMRKKGSARGAPLRSLQSMISRKPRSWYEALPVFTLKNRLGMEVTISAVGASILKILVPDSKGRKADVVLGYEEVEDYVVS